MTFQFSVRGSLQGLRPGQVSSASSSHSPGAADEALQGVFRTFPEKKSANISSAQGSELRADFAPWTLAAHLAHVDLGPGMCRDEAGFVWWYRLDNPAVHWDEPG